MNKLVDDRRQLEAMSVEELADWAASAAANSENDQVARAEFLRRQTEALEETAQFTRRGAMAMVVTAALLVFTFIAVGIFMVFIRPRRRPQDGQNGPRLQGPGQR